MSPRKLITIRQVHTILPIEGADKIELAMVDGWQCVVKKGEFKVNDFGVYAEVGTMLPVHPAFEFLRPSSYKKFIDGREGFRLKSIRLRKCLSQGLLIPLSTAAQAGLLDADLTPAFNAWKYEANHACVLSGEAKGTFPNWIPKTDQERIQNLRLDFSQDQFFEVTMKMDGSSMTCYQDHAGEFGVCSRNLDLTETEFNAFWVVARREGLQEKLRLLSEIIGGPVAIQGELMGPTLQGNPEKLTQLEFFLFDIYDVEAGKYMSPDRRRALAESLGIQHVPVIDPHKNIKGMSVAELLKYAEGPSYAAAVREGVVFKNETTTFKAISNAWLLDCDTEE